MSEGADGRGGSTGAREEREGRAAPRSARDGVRQRAGARERPVHVGVGAEAGGPDRIHPKTYLAARRGETTTMVSSRLARRRHPVRGHTTSRDPPSDAAPRDASRCRPPPPSPSFPRAPPSSADARATFAREPATSAPTPTSHPSRAATTPRPVVADSSPPSPPSPSPPPAFWTPRALPRRARSGASRCEQGVPPGRDTPRCRPVRPSRARTPSSSTDPLHPRFLLHPRDSQG